MSDDRTGFEARLADLLERYADLASVEIDPWAVAQAAAGSTAPGWRSRITWRVGRPGEARGRTRLAVMVALLALLLAAFAMAMWVGGQRHDPALPAELSPAVVMAPYTELPIADLPYADLVAVIDGLDGGLSLYDIGTGVVRSLAPDASDMRFEGSLSGAIDGRPAWSPDRTEIAYFANGGSLRVVRVADGTSRVVARTEPLSQPGASMSCLTGRRTASGSPHPRSPNGHRVPSPTSLAGRAAG